MAFYAIQRVSDGKLLPLATVRSHRGMTWSSFDKDIYEQNPAQIPAIWPSEKGAHTTMQMWKKGGWHRGSLGKITCKPIDDRKDIDVRVIPVGVVPIAPTQEELVAQELQRKPNSVLD